MHVTERQWWRLEQSQCLQWRKQRWPESMPEGGLWMKQMNAFLHWLTCLWVNSPNAKVRLLWSCHASWRIGLIGTESRPIWWDNCCTLDAESSDCLTLRISSFCVVIRYWRLQQSVDHGVRGCHDWSCVGLGWRFCLRSRLKWDKRSFLTNKCQTLEGVDHSRNRWSEAHSFCFSRKLKPTSVAQESKRQILWIPSWTTCSWHRWGRAFWLHHWWKLRHMRTNASKDWRDKGVWTVQTDDSKQLHSAKWLILEKASCSSSGHWLTDNVMPLIFILV